MLRPRRISTRPSSSHGTAATEIIETAKINGLDAEAYLRHEAQVIGLIV